MFGQRRKCLSKDGEKYGDILAAGKGILIFCIGQRSDMTRHFNMRRQETIQHICPRLGKA